MAGMLPGVECARRRRVHQRGGSTVPPNLAGHARTRRSSFCLYTSNYETLLSSSSSQRNALNQTFQDEKLGGVAREAKERLDGRLRAQRKAAEPPRHINKERVRCEHGDEGLGSSTLFDLQTEVFGSKKSSTRRFSWGKLGWKDSDQEECAVCLERFRTGETLVHLPCAHRFHSRCVVPWLESNAHCPCCRMGILS